MKAIAFAQRLLRDLKEKDLAALAADARLELLDAINGAIQDLHAVSPPHSKRGTAGIFLAAPAVFSATFANGSTGIEWLDTYPNDYHCTVRIDGDGADNQLIAADTLLHPYAGTDGIHSLTLYHDATALREPVEEFLGDPENIDTGETLVQDATRAFRHGSGDRSRRMRTGEPKRWWVEDSSRNNNGDAPAIFRVDSLPTSQVRLSAEVILGPARITFADILDSAADIPVRAEHIESRLLPVARGNLAESSLWRSPESRQSAISGRIAAIAAHSILTPKYTASPANRVFTPRHY